MKKTKNLKKGNPARKARKTSRKKPIQKASKVTNKSFAKKSANAQGTQNARRGAGSRVRRKKIWFEDFYDEQIVKQAEDFIILCKRYGYKSYAKELVEQAEEMRDAFYREISVGVPAEREDLTAECIITIDGDDAKDFDDAVSVKKVGDKYELGVHIADVSHFIKPGSGLDREAYRRATSVYLINEVLPMFPEAISNDLCSLVPEKIRFTYSCFLTISAQGQILDYHFAKSAIKSKRRCTYREVEGVLRGTNTFGELDAQIRIMNELKTILRMRRLEAGSLTFVTSETYFELGDETVDTVSLKHPLEAENLIEEFMLVANICAARAISQHGLGIYRVHDEPKPEKLHAFERMVKEKGLELPRGGSINPLKLPGKNRYQIFLETLPENELKENLSFLLLTSMSQAVYSDRNIGHYGLAFTHYTHFTSPIRRYPDLVVHRSVHGYLGDYEQVNSEDTPARSAQKNRAGNANKLKGESQTLRKIAEWSSKCERQAVDAEREYHKLKGMRYLEQDPERVLTTTVMKVMDVGMYVREVNTGIEGFVSVYAISPDLYYDEIREALTRKREVVYELGTPASSKN